MWRELLSVYPKRGGALGHTEGRKVLERLLKAKVDPQTILEGAKRYAAYIRATKREGTEYVAMIPTWLRQRRWEEDWTPPRDPKAEEEEAKRRHADACNASDDDLRTFAARAVSRSERYPAYAELARHAQDRRMDTVHTDLVSVMDEQGRHWLVPAGIADQYTPYDRWLHSEAERIRRERGGPSFRARRLLRVATHQTDEYDPFADGD